MNSVLQKYADLTVKTGVNITKGDSVVISAEADCHDFVVMIADAAYRAGAKTVTTILNSEKIMRLRYQYESKETLSDVPQWRIDALKLAVEQDAAYISIVSGNPEAFSGIDSTKIATYSKAFRSKAADFYRATMNNDIRWTIIAYPGKEWSQKVFPDAEDAQQKLFELIAKAMRLDAKNPVKAEVYPI